MSETGETQNVLSHSRLMSENSSLSLSLSLSLSERDDRLTGFQEFECNVSEKQGTHVDAEQTSRIKRRSIGKFDCRESRRGASIIVDFP